MCFHAQEVSPGTLQLTGILGLAALLYGYYSLRGNPKPDDADQRRINEAGTSGSQSTQANNAAKPQHSTLTSSSAASQPSVSRLGILEQSCAKHTAMQTIMFVASNPSRLHIFERLVVESCDSNDFDRYQRRRGVWHGL